MPPSAAPPDILTDPNRTIDESTIESYEEILAMETGAGFKYIKRCKWSSLRNKHAEQLNPRNNTYLTAEEKDVLVKLAAKFVFNGIAVTKKNITDNARMVGVLFGTSDGTVTEAYYKYQDPEQAEAQALRKRQYMQRKREQELQQRERNSDEDTPLAVINQNGDYAVELAGTKHHHLNHDVASRHNSVAASLEATATTAEALARCESLERKLAAMITANKKLKAEKKELQEENENLQTANAKQQEKHDLTIRELQASNDKNDQKLLELQAAYDTEKEEHDLMIRDLQASNDKNDQKLLELQAAYDTEHEEYRQTKLYLQAATRVELLDFLQMKSVSVPHVAKLYGELLDTASTTKQRVIWFRSLAKCARQNKCIDLTEKLSATVDLRVRVLTELKGFRDYVRGTVAGWAFVDLFVKLLEIVELYNSLTDEEDQQRSDQLQALADLAADPLFDWTDDQKRHYLVLLESISRQLHAFVSDPAFEAYVKIDDDDEEEDCVQKKREAFAALKKSIAALPVDSLHDDDDEAESHETSDSTPNDSDDDDEDDEEDEDAEDDDDDDDTDSIAGFVDGIFADADVDASWEAFLSFGGDGDGSGHT